MSKDVHVNLLMPVENFVVFKNKLRKEMSETPEEDLEAYKKFEWERAVAWWGPSWDNIKNDKVDKNLLVQVRDLLGYSWETYPITDEEHSILDQRAKEKRLADRQAKKEADRARLELQLKEQQEAWDRLTPEEQSAQLKQQRKNDRQKLAFEAISVILIISGILAYYTVS